MNTKKWAFDVMDRSRHDCRHGAATTDGITMSGFRPLIAAKINGQARPDLDAVDRFAAKQADIRFELAQDR